MNDPLGGSSEQGHHIGRSHNWENSEDIQESEVVVENRRRIVRLEDDLYPTAEQLVT